MKTLFQVKRLPTRALQDEKVFFTGDILLNTFETAMDLVRTRTATAGTWHACAFAGSGDDEERPVSHWHFKPGVVEKLPDQVYHVLAYDPDGLALICSTPQGEHVRLTLNEPMYRFSKRLHYGQGSGSRVIKGVRYDMAHAWLDPARSGAYE